jgi:hypothetical protein
LIRELQATLTADIALAARGSGVVDISTRADADVPWVSGDDLPCVDRALTSIALGDAAALLSKRDQLQLLAECRRVLAPGARIILAESRSADVHWCLARWAAMVGLSELPAESTDRGWCKRDISRNQEPLVSILIPAWNPRFFRECLDSAIAQTYRHIEIIVCDDSNGPTISAMVASRSQQSTIHYVKNPVRLKARGNYTKCLSLARGEYIKFLNDDDVLAPDCVRTLLSAFLHIPDLSLATSHRRLIDAGSRVMEDMPATRPVVDCDVVVNGFSLANAVIMHGLNFIGEPSTTLFRKRDVEARADVLGDGAFRFNGEEVRGAIDLAMWTRLLVQGNAAFFNERLSDFRRHGEQAQAQPDVVARSIEGIRGLQREWIKLGLFRLFPPHLLACQPFTRTDDQSDEWQLTPVRWNAPSNVSPEEATRKWRATQRHPFDFL